MSLEDLGQAIRERRGELDLTQEDVRAAGGPAAATLTRLEEGSERLPYFSTYHKLDVALKWRPGTAKHLALQGPLDHLQEQPTAQLVAQVRELLYELESRLSD